MSNLFKRGLGIAVLACAACCAVPLATALGVGGAFAGVGGLVAGFMGSEIACVALLIAASVTALFFFVRARRRARAATCETSCRTDGECCQAHEVSESPIQANCSLSVVDRAGRAAEFHALLAKAFRSRRRDGDAVTWELAALPGVFDESRRLAALEKTCCAPLSFDVNTEGDVVRWRIEGSPRARNLLKMFYELPTVCAVLPRT